MEYGKTISGQIMFHDESGWYWYHSKRWVNVTKCDREKAIPISKLEFLLRTGTSPEKVGRQLQRHVEIIKRRHELFQKLARGEIKEFTANDIIGSESDE